MTVLPRFFFSAACAYLAGSAGFIAGEALGAAGSRTTNAAGVPIAVWSLLPGLARAPFTNAGFALTIGVFCLVLAGLALWFSRLPWLRSGHLLTVLLLSMGAGFLLGVVGCVLVWLLFGGWGPPAPLLFIGAAVAALFSSCVFSRSSTRPAPAAAA